jgi:hypothetical protein
MVNAPNDRTGRNDHSHIILNLQRDGNNVVDRPRCVFRATRLSDFDRMIGTNVLKCERKMMLSQNGLSQKKVLDLLTSTTYCEVLLT